MKKKVNIGNIIGIIVVLLSFTISLILRIGGIFIGAVAILIGGLCSNKKTSPRSDNRNE